MEHFPPRHTVPLTEPGIPPHFAALPTQNGAPNHGSPSHRSFAEETTLGEDHISQGHSGQSEGTHATLWHEVSNGRNSPQQDLQEADKPQSPPPRTQITYPTLPPSPPAVPASKQTFPHHHLSPSYLCHSQDCGWKVAYLKLRCVTRKLIDETEESVRGFRWAVDDMERKMSANANFLDELNGKWRDCGGTSDVEEGKGENMRDEVARGVGVSARVPSRDRGDRVLGGVVYPDLREAFYLD